MRLERFQEGWSIAVDPPQAVRYNFLDPILSEGSSTWN
jgi:hypothetical protein